MIGCNVTDVLRGIESQLKVALWLAQKPKESRTQALNGCTHRLLPGHTTSQLISNSNDIKSFEIGTRPLAGACTAPNPCMY
jgi:hypothetical protein